MRTIANLTVTAAIAGLVAAASPSQAADFDRLEEPISVRGDAVIWKSGPASLPEGAQVAVLEGDLTKAEPHTFRLRFPDGYRVAPHSHPLREHITVLQGTLMMGMGETFDREAADPLPAGSFFVLPTGDRHYVWTEGETVVQLHGIGPWGIEYVDPADDPRKAASQ